MSKKNKVSYNTLKIKQLCHFKMSETNHLVTWNYISGQRPQLQQCKRQKTCTCKNMAMMQPMWGYTQKFQVHGDFKIRKIMNINVSIFICSVTGNIQFQIKWLSSKTKKWNIAVKDWYYYRLPLKGQHPKRGSLKHCDKLPIFTDV